MNLITLKIPNNIKKSLYLDNNNQISILNLFSQFWIDFKILLKEREYQKKYLNDIKTSNYIVSNEF